jgi:hypothetical protein
MAVQIGASIGESAPIFKNFVDGPINMDPSKENKAKKKKQV